MLKVLCMDSAHKHLNIALIEDGEIKASFSEECWKRQSETLFPQLIQCMENAKWKVEDIERVIITKGPGSYTGVRIAMCVAKVFCSQRNVPLYTLDTLKLYAGLKKNIFVMLDARSSRAYCAHLDESHYIMEPCILTIDEIRSYLQDKDCEVVGDTTLIDQERVDIDFSKHFLDLYQEAQFVDNIHTLVPTYLKENDAYRVK